MVVLPDSILFQWDRGNKDKNLLKHSVTNQECEQVFFDRHKKVFPDLAHSKKEKRYIILGKTKDDRLLYMVFTQRSNKVRIISARNLNKKEYKLYQ